MSTARFFLVLHLLLAALTGTAVSEPEPAIAYVMQYFEGGGQVVANDAGRGVACNGLVQALHPEAGDVTRRSRAEAARLYRREYWNPLAIGTLPENIRFLVFDTAVNMGVARTRTWLAQAHGDAARLWRLRTEWHRHLLAANPALYGPYELSWRLRDLVVAAAASLPIDMNG